METPDLTTAQIHAAAPFAATLGIAFSRLDPSEVVAVLEGDAAYGTLHGGTHGGALMALGDVAATVCAILGTGGRTTSTVQASTSFLRPLTGRATAHATPARVGRTTVFLDVRILDDQDRVCVQMTQVQAVLPPRPDADA
jgi:uncharacterized protein (TIGR00369 family)